MHQYALFNPGRGSIWYLTGMAMRQCIEYGYHHEVLQHSMNASPLEIDMKRRLFWTTYKVRCSRVGIYLRPVLTFSNF